MNQNVLDSLNKVEGFSPEQYLIALPEKEMENGAGIGTESERYLPTKYRILWFRLKYPKGQILTSHTITDTYVDACTQISLAAGEPPLAVSHSMKWIDRTSKFGAVESAETASTGRALALLGFGTQMCGNDFGEDPVNDPADGPVKIPSQLEPGSGSDAAPVQGAEKTSSPASPAKTAKSDKKDKPTTDKPNSPEIEKRIDEAISKMTNLIAGGTIVPCGMYKDMTFKELMMQDLHDQIWYFTNKYVPHTDHDIDIVAAARFIKRRCDAKKAELAAANSAATEPLPPVE